MRGYCIFTVEGNLSGLKPNQIKKLEKLYQRRIDPTAVITQDLARQLTEISKEIHRQVGLLINRKGCIEYVVVGDSHGIVIPDLKRVRIGHTRLRGLRCIHTQFSDKGLTSDDLTDLTALRLDLMAVIQVTTEGLPNWIQVAHLVPISQNIKPTLQEHFETNDSLDLNTETPKIEVPWICLPKVHPSKLDIDFLSLITSLEFEFAHASNQNSKNNKQNRALLVGVTSGSVSEALDSLAELKELAISSELEVVDYFIQRRTRLDSNTVLGKGKLQELIIRSFQTSADLIIFDNNLSPSQIRSIEQAIDLKIIDRTQLILDIFAQRAQSREGKIQVELAQLKYLLPRLTGKGTELSRLEGGIGGRGPGETKLEVDRRRARSRITMLEKSLDGIRNNREIRRGRRRRRDLPVVSIVGYTNAGKSTLLNVLTDSKVLAESRMFATLDPTSRQLRLPSEQEIIINDTVGFIRDLPKTLIAAFKATLEELEDSDLLIHLIDITAINLTTHIEAVDRILSELKLSELPCLLVFNKCDLVDSEKIQNLCSKYDALAISAINPKTLDLLLNSIESKLKSFSSYSSPIYLQREMETL